jgi:hypothetical protein
MNHDTSACTFPALTSDFLRSSDSLIDNIFADLWKLSVLTLGLSCTEGFVPIDSELFTGKTKVVDLPAP